MVEEKTSFSVFLHVEWEVVCHLFERSSQGSSERGQFGTLFFFNIILKRIVYIQLFDRLTVYESHNFYYINFEFRSYVINKFRCSTSTL